MDTHSHSDKKNNAPVTEQTSQEEFLPDELSIFSDFRGIQRAIKEPNPHLLTPNVVLQLQRTIGNKAVQRLLSERVVQRNVVPPPPVAVQTRQLNFITVKMNGQWIDHWWIEIDGAESYGWWPSVAPSDDEDPAWTHGVAGVPGVLNGVGRTDLDGTATTDPHHGESAPESFQPYTINRSNSLSDDDIRQRIRDYANSFTGDYRILVGPNCHTFIQGMMRHVGLSRGRPTSTHPNIP